MPEISLTDFVDFSISIGSSQLTKVRQIFSRGEYDPRFDFWKPLRETIQQYHFGKKSLDEVLVGLTDKKKITRYPPAVLAYKRFIGKKVIVPFKPPSAIWSYGGLDVRVNPELGLELQDSRYVIKLYFKDEKLSAHRLKIVHCMMDAVLNLTPSRTSAVLDVASAKLIPSKRSDSGLLPMLEAQAMSFVHMWKACALRARATAGN